MRRCLIWLCLIAAASCVPQAASAAEPMQVGVVDLVEVARALGQVEAIRERLIERKNLLQERIDLLASSYRKEYETEKARYGAQPKEEHKQAIREMEQRMTKNFEEAKTVAKNELEAYEKQCVNEFRQTVAPVARQVAQVRGCSVVLARNDEMVLAYTTQADLTSAVIAAMKTQVAENEPPEPERTQR